jgi:small subunit ribosomal protein S14
LFFPKNTPQPDAHVKHNDPKRPRLEVGGTGSVFDTKIKRRTEIANPNEPKDPLFYTRRTEGLKWTDNRMLRDVHRRRGISEYFSLRQNLMMIKKSYLLPEELRVQSHRDLQVKLPIFTTTSHCTDRCVISSRGRGVNKQTRLSRFFFRHFADYNQLSGVQKAKWGP